MQIHTAGLEKECKGYLRCEHAEVGKFEQHDGEDEDGREEESGVAPVALVGAGEERRRHHVVEIPRSVNLDTVVVVCMVGDGLVPGRGFRCFALE